MRGGRYCGFRDIFCGKVGHSRKLCGGVFRFDKFERFIVHADDAERIGDYRHLGKIAALGRADYCGNIKRFGICAVDIFAFADVEKIAV